MAQDMDLITYLTLPSGYFCSDFLVFSLVWLAPNAHLYQHHPSSRKKWKRAKC